MPPHVIYVFSRILDKSSGATLKKLAGLADEITLVWMQNQTAAATCVAMLACAIDEVPIRARSNIFARVVDVGQA